MKRIKVFLLALSVTVFTLISSGLPSVGDTTGVSGNIIKMGVIIDQTGPAAGVGIPYAKGFKDYFRYVNDTGGINGRKVKVILEDDGYSIPRAFAAFKKLVFKDKVLSIFGCGGTGQNTALFPQIKKHKVPVISVSWSWTMTDPLKRYIFTPGNDNKDEIRIIMNYVVKTIGAKNPRFAIVSPDVEYGKSGVRVAEAKAKELGVKMVGREILPLGAIDATTQILSLKRKKATHIITLTMPGQTLSVLRSARNLRFTPIFFNSFHIFADEIAKIAGEAAGNMYGVAAFASWFDNVEGVKNLKKVTLKYYPNMELPNRYYVKAWISSIIAGEGIRRSSNNLTPDTFVDALETIRNLDMKGLTGPINYSPTDHKGNDYARLYKADIEKGYFLPVTDWIRSE